MPGTCNAVVNGAMLVAGSSDPGPIPVGTGGTLTDGRYYLTEAKAYAGASLAGFMQTQTVEISCGGTVGQFVNQKGATEIRKTWTLNPVGTDPGFKIICSSISNDPDLMYSSFTATPTSFTFYSATLGFSGTFTKQ